MIRMQHLDDADPNYLDDAGQAFGGLGTQSTWMMRIQYLDETDPDHLNYADPALG